MLEFDVDAVPWRKDLVTHPLSIEDGELVLGDAPGWGMDIREDVALAHAVKR
jgi:galactonate dehydratase